MIVLFLKCTDNVFLVRISFNLMMNNYAEIFLNKKEWLQFIYSHILNIPCQLPHKN
jgi:hypothetical protein